MSAQIKQIKKDSTVKIISGANKGIEAKVVAVLTKKNAVLLEGIGQRHRKIKPSQLNPYGGHKDVHAPVSLHKVALVKEAAKTAKKEKK